MAKKVHTISQFHGGLNTQANPSDLKDNEMPILEDAMVDELGKIKMMGGIATSIDTADTSGITGTMKAGYGIHAWKSDYTGAEDKGSSEATTGDNYVAMYDGDDGQVWVYSDAVGTSGDGWDDDVSSSTNGVIDIGSSNTSSAQPCFYSIDGGLRISDGNHSSSNLPQWYQYIKRTLFQSGSDTVSDDKWYATNQFIISPDNTSSFSTSTSTFSFSAGTSYTTSAIGADSNHIQSSTLFDHTGEVANMRGGIEVVVRITTANYTVFPSGDDFNCSFTLTTGSGTSSSFNGSAGVNYKETTTTESGSATPSGTKDITLNFSFNNDYHNGSSTGSSFDTSDDTNGIRTTLTSESFNSTFITSIALHTVKVTEGTLSSTGAHSTLTNNNAVFECAISAAPSGSLVASGWDTIWEHGFSFIYDEKQESLVRRLYDVSDSTVTTQTISNATYAPITKFYLKHGNSTTFNRRITGAVWYIRDASGSSFNPWTAQIEYDFVKGVSRVLSTGKEFDCSLNPYSNEYVFEVDHDYLLSPNLVDTYRSRTNVSDKETSIKSSYKTAVVANRVTYIGNVKITKEDGTTEVRGDAMLKSPPNRNDIFPSTQVVEASINDGESIVKLETFADRILQFKQDTLYVINIAQGIEFLEDVHQYKGISHPSMSCKTDYGIAWVNKLGCYLYDGRAVTNLLEKGGQKLIDDDTWQAHVKDAADESSMIGYLPKKRQLIVVKDNGDNGNAGDIFLYDMVTKSWTFGDSKMTDSQIKSNFIIFKNDLIYMHTNTVNDFVKWDSSPDSSGEFKFYTKDINFGLPGIRKKVYAVYVTYKANADTELQMEYRTNGATTNYDFSSRTNTFDEGGSDLAAFADSEDSTVELSYTSNITRIASMKPAQSMQANNINSIQLLFYADTGQTVPSSLEIDNIEIIYRVKGIR